MSKRAKQEKIAELNTLPNVFQEPGPLRGHWNEIVFENQNPIVLELGCGRGEYTVNMARHFPEKNFVGVDIKGPRIWKGARDIFREKIQNAAFVRTLIERITDYFGEKEVSEIWVTFPDPYPQPAKAMKRLVSVRFLELYKEILKPGGLIHFKTDNTPLFDWAMETFRANAGVEILEWTNDLYNSDLLNEITSIKTTYEGIFTAQGHTIKYCIIRFREDVPLDNEQTLKEKMAEK